MQLENDETRLDDPRFERNCFVGERNTPFRRPKLESRKAFVLLLHSGEVTPYLYESAFLFTLATHSWHADCQRSSNVALRQTRNSH